MKNKSGCKYQLKIFLNNGRVLSYHSKKKKRIAHKIKGQKISEVQKYWLRVDYGEIIDNFGKKVRAINEGEYYSLAEILQAWKCFNEKS